MVKMFLAVLLACPLAVFGSFTEEPQFGTGYSLSLGWADYDNDGDLDIVVGNNGQNYLYSNDGIGGFNGVPEFGMGITDSVAWGDYDNDGDDDLAVGDSYEGENRLFINEDGGGFIEEEQFGTWESLSFAWGDYDNDGDLDVAEGTFHGYPITQNYLYINDGAGGFTEVPEFGGGHSCSVAWGDYDNDGDIDLAVGNSGYSSINRLYVNDGLGGFTEEEQFGAPVPPYEDTTSIAWGDYDNDGDLDLAVGISRVKQNYLYVNNGDGSFIEEPKFGTGFTMSIAWGDYDNDGYLDLAVGNSHDEQNYLYTNNGDGSFTEEPQFGSADDDSESVAWGDYDDDGDLDLAVANCYNEQNYLYVNNEDDGDYLVFKLVGHFYDNGSGYSNRNGIGAKVSVYSEGYVGNIDYLLGFREIEANGGYCGQDSIDAEFGLPDDERVDVLVIWPGSDGSQIEEAWLGVERGQHLTLHEGQGSPLDIVLNSFEAKPDCEGVILRWDVNTTGDTEIAGFNLYRSTNAGEAKAITSLEKLNTRLITGESPYTYLDATVNEGVTYNYWLEAIDVGGAAETFGPVDCTWNGALPTTYTLYQSRPNPAKGSATISFDLPEDANVTLAVYDISGRKVTTVVDRTLPAGEHEVEVSGLAPGVYVYRLKAAEFSAVKKMVIQ